MGGKLLISKSKINTLETCPLLFKFQYLEHRVPDIPKADVTQIGTDIHQIFHDFFDNIKLEEIPDEPYEYFCNAMKVDDRYRRIYNHFCKIETDIYKILKDKKYFMPLLREQEITINDIRGIIDRVDYDGENYSIIDYKSNVSNPSKLRFELCFYKYLIDQANILDAPVKYIGSYGYKDGGIFFEEVNTRSYNLMMKKVDGFRNLKLDTLQFAPTPGGACSWCEYPRSCKQWYEQMRF